MFYSFYKLHLSGLPRPSVLSRVWPAASPNLFLCFILVVLWSLFTEHSFPSWATYLSHRWPRLAFTSQRQCSQRRPHSVFFLSARYRLADHPVNFHCNAGKSASLFYLHICVFTYCQTLYKNLSSLMSGTCLAIPLWIPNDSRSACPKIRLSINCW